MNIEIHRSGRCVTPDGKDHADRWEACRHMIACGVDPAVVVRIKNGTEILEINRIGHIARLNSRGGQWIPPRPLKPGTPIHDWWTQTPRRR